jgi:hypothetical protein
LSSPRNTASRHTQRHNGPVPCIFCGNPKLSREHIYSRAWIERLIPDAESHTNWLSRDLEGDPVATWTSSDADVVLRCVCRDCNSGWMNDLDRTAEPIVNELARGENRVRAEGGALQVFATWAVKMALVMECALTPMVLDQETRQRFSRERHRRLSSGRGLQRWRATRPRRARPR